MLNDNTYKLGYRGEYRLWLGFYIFINIIAAWIMLDTNLLIGDLDTFPVLNKTTLVLAAFLVCLSYFVILRLFYGFITRIEMVKIFPITEDDKSKKILGIIILVLQLLFMLFNYTEGVNTAGSGTVRSDSIFNTFWIFITIDMVFTIYYGMNREDKMFKPNVVVFVISNVMRGWTGFFLTFVFMEWCRAYRLKKINFLKVAVILIVGLLCYPFVYNLKLVMRSFKGDYSNLAYLSQFFFSNLEGIDLLDLFKAGISHLTGRLQITAIVSEIINYKDLLQDEFNRGNILPFWGEGIPQIGYRKLMGIASPPNVGVALTDYLYPKGEFEMGSWNVNVGFVGWFFIAPGYSFIYILYMAFLCFLSVFLVKQAGNKPGGFDVLWYSWLVYLIAGWTLAFTGFIYSVLLYLILKVASQQLARITFRKRLNET